MPKDDDLEKLLIRAARQGFPIPPPPSMEAMLRKIHGIQARTEKHADTTEAPALEAELDTLARFNRRVALELGAAHASTHLHFKSPAKEALVAPGRTSWGCITLDQLVSPTKDSGRFTVRLFGELLPRLTEGARAAVYGREFLQPNSDLTRTVYGETFKCLLAGLIEDQGRPIGIVKLENQLSSASGAFDESAPSTLLRLIRQFTPHLLQAHRRIEQQDWVEVQFDVPPAN